MRGGLDTVEVVPKAAKKEDSCVTDGKYVERKLEEQKKIKAWLKDWKEIILPLPSALS